MILLTTEGGGAGGPLSPEGARRLGLRFFGTSPTITLMLMSFLLVALFLMDDGIRSEKRRHLNFKAKSLPKIAFFDYHST